MVPIPALWVERFYADTWYPSLQSLLTSWSNQSGLSLFDALIAVAALVALIAWVRVLRQAWRARSPRLLVSPSIVTLTCAAAAYLWFQLAWGLNYARPPLEQTIGYDRNRVTAAALRALADRATTETNATYAAAHRAGFAPIGEVPPALVAALHEVEHRLGRPRPTTPGRPKRSALALFFRMSGVDGMHAPLLLETLLNPDLTPPERPAVLAHEWAHLSGYAPEADASFVGLLAALRADPSSQYSAWLTIFEDAVGQLPATERRPFLSRLDPGPRADRSAIAKRLLSRVDVVARASWETYDRYLKSQGVREGLQSYSRVVQLLLGSGALDWRDAPQ
jgi:hypothetical protein